MQTDPTRNRPADEGRNEDPNLRDHSGMEPGIQTISRSDTDADQNTISETGKDGYRPDTRKDPNADRAFDEINEEE